jgi:hypothetical protein
VSGHKCDKDSDDEKETDDEEEFTLPESELQQQIYIDKDQSGVHYQKRYVQRHLALRHSQKK